MKVHRLEFGKLKPKPYKLSSEASSAITRFHNYNDLIESPADAWSVVTLRSSRTVAAGSPSAAIVEHGPLPKA